MNVPHLLARALACGFAVAVTPDGPELRPVRREAWVPPDLLADLRDAREELVAYLSRCEVCGRDASDPGDRERLKDPAFCEQGGDWRRGIPRCPFKEPA